MCPFRATIVAALGSQDRIVANQGKSALSQYKCSIGDYILVRAEILPSLIIAHVRVLAIAYKGHREGELLETCRYALALRPHSPGLHSVFIACAPVIEINVLKFDVPTTFLICSELKWIVVGNIEPV